MSATEQVFPSPLDALVGVTLVEPVEPSLVLHYTELCNARCAHCVVEAGPWRKGHADATTMRAAIEGAQRAGVRHVVVTGGESFIYLDEVLELCRYARDMGLRTRVITNGYWALTPQRAASMLERVVAGGLDQLVISFDDYHLPYVRAERVRNVFYGARLAQVLPYLVFSTVVDHDAGIEVVDGVPWQRAVLDVLDAYGFDHSECVPRDVVRAQAQLLDYEAAARFRDVVVRERAIINWNPVAYAGRASSDLAVPRGDSSGGGPCPVAGRQVTITSSGRLYPCCSVWSTFDDHSFGTISDASAFVPAATSMYADPLVRLIREDGPGALVAQLEREGRTLDVEVSDACHMCERMLRTTAIGDLRDAALRALDGAAGATALQPPSS